MVTKTSPVAQNRYLLDLENSKLSVYGEFEAHTITINHECTLFEWIIKLSKNNQKSIIYCNSKSKTIESALDFSKLLSKKKNPVIKKLCELVSDSLHQDYFLIDCLEKGVAYHFGDLPQSIRIKIEDAFQNGDLDYIFCTSTLLEGINMPVKNIFVLSEKLGRENF